MKYKIIRLNEVESKTGLSKSTIYLQIKEKQFPDSVNLGKRAVGWLVSDIEEWIDQRVKISRDIKKRNNYDSKRNR
jgi:prophage regulatory protein